MQFKMKYQIKKVFLSSPSKRRSGRKIDLIKFIVAHDTGNEGSTARANVMYYERSKDEISASAHIFVDGLEIIECIPAFDNPEVAWHVLFNVDTDNKRYGYDANTNAIGVELCFGGQVNNHEAYKRYVWVLAYICYKYQLDPRLDIVGHDELDPKRKQDPTNALSFLNKTIEDLIDDVSFELEICKMGDDPQVQEILRRIEMLENQNKMSTPEWAKEAVKSASAKGLIKETDNGSLDFYRLLTILHRAKVI